MMRRHGTSGSQCHPLTESGPIASETKADMLKHEENQVFCEIYHSLDPSCRIRPVDFYSST